MPELEMWRFINICSCLHVFIELTHEFLQILEKTPSRLKRIRNWRVRVSTVVFIITKQ